MYATLRSGSLPGLALTGLALAACCMFLGPPAAAQSGTWTAKAPMPAPRNEVVAAAVGGKIYVLGGSVAGNWQLTRNEEYDPATDRWRVRAPMPSGASHMAAAVLDGRILAIGGFVGQDHKGAVDHVFEYDPAADTWRTLPPLSTPRGSVSAATIDGKVHAVGGRVTTLDGDWHSAGVVATHEVYDPAANAWTAAAPLPKARDHLVAATAGGKLHVIGGRFASNDDMIDWHDVFDPATGTWTAAPPLPTPRGGVSGTVFKGLILVLGGEDEKRAYAENEAYDVSAGRWLKLKPLPAGRHGDAVAAVGDAVYVVGGALQRGAGDTTAELLAFTLP